MRIHTLNNSQQDNYDEKEKCNVKHDAVDLVIVAIWWFNFITNTTTGSHSFVKMEDKALKTKSSKDFNICKLPFTVIYLYMVSTNDMDMSKQPIKIKILS